MMWFVHHDLGYRQRGEIVEITHSARAANVRLMDPSNFCNYRSGQEHLYYGGVAKRSLIRLQIPRSGNWHVTVDVQGLRGTVHSSARVLPGPLPAFGEVPLSSVPGLIQNPPGLEGEESRSFDVFISHAPEDKETIVRPFADALAREGLEVWYDGLELKLGDSFRHKIDQGRAASRVGIVVLSKALIAKGSANDQWDGIVMRPATGEQLLLPILHNISKAEVMALSPSLARNVARSTATHTIEEIAAELAELIRGSAVQAGKTV